MNSYTRRAIQSNKHERMNVIDEYVGMVYINSYYRIIIEAFVYPEETAPKAELSFASRSLDHEKGVFLVLVDDKFCGFASES